VSEPAVLTPRAQRELESALRWIARDNTAAARGLNDAVLAAAGRLGANPHLGDVRPALSTRYRFWSLTRYSYVLVYDPATRPVRILRVVHTARDLPRLLARLAR
jgi:toxin ParE1/3/4